MIETFHERDEALVRYHFNELGDVERTELEDEMLLDEALSERAQIVEMNLIDGYVRGELTAEENVRFEKGFMASPDNRDKVNQARMFHNSLLRLHERGTAAPPESVPGQAVAAPRRGWLHRLSELFRMPLPALAFMASILLLTFGALLYVSYVNRRIPANSNAVARYPTPPAPEPTPTVAPTANSSPTPDATPPRRELPPATPPTKAPPSGGVELARNDRGRYTKEVYLFRDGQTNAERSGGDPVPITPDKKIRYLKLVHELLGDIRDRDSFFVTIYDRYNDPIELNGGERKQEVRTVRRREAGRLRRYIIIEVPLSAFKDKGPYKFEIDEPNFSPAPFTITTK